MIVVRKGTIIRFGHVERINEGRSVKRIYEASVNDEYMARSCKPNTSAGLCQISE